MAENEKTLEKPPPVEAGKKKKETKTDGVFLPVLLEFTFTFSVILLILLFLTMISVSVLTGTSLLNTVIRTSVTMLIIGSLLILISRQVSSEVLNANNVQEKKTDPSQFEELKGIEPKSSSEAQ
jgi:hypothetical protein